MAKDLIAPNDAADTTVDHSAPELKSVHVPGDMVNAAFPVGHVAIEYPVHGFRREVGFEILMFERQSVARVAGRSTHRSSGR